MLILKRRSLHRGIAILAAVAVAALLAVALQGPIPQPAEYHDFADRRSLLRIPNFWNVVSNFPFLIFGGLGLLAIWRGPAPGVLPPLKQAYVCFFIGAALVALGSGYYHWSPDHATLVWDRLPMTIAFMAFFAIMLGEQLDPRLGRAALWPLVLAGIASVVYWHLSENAGRGDLRPYVIVQFVPMLLVPLMLLLFRSRLNRTHLIWAVLGAYAVAKLVEALDRPLFELTGQMSGHSLKHLAAAAGAYFMWRAVLVRRVEPGPRESAAASR
jgi:hypothetical protein